LHETAHLHEAVQGRAAFLHLQFVVQAQDNSSWHTLLAFGKNFPCLFIAPGPPAPSMIDIVHCR